MIISTDYQHQIQVSRELRRFDVGLVCLGSYVNAYKNQRRRLEDERVSRKSVMTDYKNFVQNGGFGPSFGNTDFQTYEQKVRSSDFECCSCSRNLRFVF